MVAGMLLPNRRVLQPAAPPRINAYWRSRGLVYVFLGNRLYATANGARPWASVNGGPKSVAQPMGITQGFGSTSGTGSTDYLVGPPLALSAGIRSIVSFSFGNSPGGGGLGRIFQSVSGNGADAAEAMYIGTGGYLTYSRFSTSQNQWNIGPVYPTGVWNCYGLTHDQSVASNPLSYFDGLPANTGNVVTPGGTYATGQYNPAFGNRPSDLARSWDGRIGATLFFDHPFLGLTEAEHRTLRLNPWQVFEIADLEVLVQASSSTAYLLTCASGSYTLTGQAAALRVARRLMADPGQYDLLGQSVALRVARRMALAHGTYALTGQNASFFATRRLIAAQGSYVLSGQDATLSKSGVSPKLTCDTGYYVMTGQDAQLRVARRLIAAQGAYALTGQVVNFRVSRALDAQPGSYQLNGQAATFRKGNPVLVAERGLYFLTGFDAQLIASGQSGSSVYDIVLARRRGRL
jgi:hypothetical protein